MTIQTQVSGQANSFRTTPAKCATSSSADLAPKKLDHYLYFVRPCWDYIRSALCLTWEAHQVGRCSWSVAHEKSYCKGSLYEITLQAMPTPKLLDQVRTVIRVRHFSLSTERAYVSWIRRFILFHNKRHPNEMAEAEIRQFISHLAVDAKISASTQTVALSALLFLYRDVLMMTSNAHSGLSTQHSALSTQDSALSTQHDASCTRSSSDSKHV